MNESFALYAENLGLAILEDEDASNNERLLAGILVALIQRGSCRH